MKILKSHLSFLSEGKREWATTFLPSVMFLKDFNRQESKNAFSRIH